MARLQRKALDRPDEERKIPGGRLNLYDLGDSVVGYTVMEPGWRWSTHIKPIAGTEYCEFHHQGYTLSGRVRVVSREGAEIELGPLQFYEIPPHHDAWVIGDEPWVTIDWGSATSFAQPTWGNEKQIISNVLFTDIVGSTDRARELGDGRWRDLLSRHNDLARSVVERFGGREVASTGDGFLMLFDGAERAVRAGLAMAEAVREAGLEIRAGVHTGDVVLDGTNVRGLAVHIGARIMALAGPSEVLVSWTTRDLLAGADLRFEDRGLHELKGLPDPRPVYAVATARGRASD
jgi:hypothetical protein